ncbi:MAG: hypothetical protein AAF654_00600 [Myxococcota bacterium]
MSQSLCHAALPLVVCAFVCASGCGRTGFGDSQDENSLPGDDPTNPVGGRGAGGGGSGEPGQNRLVTPATFSSSSNACESNASGPFAQAGSTVVQRSYGLWWEPPFLLVAGPGFPTGGFRSYRLIAGQLELVDEDVQSGFFEAVYFDGSYFYVGVPGLGLLVYELDASGLLTRIAENSDELAQARQAWGDGTFVYVPLGTDGIRAIRFNGSEIELVGDPLPSEGFGLGVTVVEDDIYFADDAKLRVLNFDGSALTEVAEVTLNSASRAWSALGVVFVSGRSEVAAVRRNGSTIDRLGTFVAPGDNSIRDVWSDGSLVYAVDQENGVYALEYDAATESFNQLGGFPVPDGGDALGVVGNSEQIFVAYDRAGLVALDGFACTAP